MSILINATRVPVITDPGRRERMLLKETVEKLVSRFTSRSTVFKPR